MRSANYRVDTKSDRVCALHLAIIGTAMLNESDINQITIAPYVLLALHTLGGVGNSKLVAEVIADSLELSEEFLSKTTSKNNAPVFLGYIYFSKLRLSWAGYIDNSERGKWALTKKAKDIIPALRDEQSHSAFVKEVKDESNKEGIKKRKEKKANSEIMDEEKDVEKRLVDETQKEETELTIIKNITPEQFERLCAILFKEAGYVDVENTQLSRDGGYDGQAFYLLGLTRMKVVFESKRYSDGKVVEAKIRQLQQVKTDEKAEKAVFITTASFTKDAKNRAHEYGMELIDGKRLIELLKKYEIGFEQQIDKSFFDDI